MGVLDTSYTFDNNDTITSTKMNNIIDQSSFTSGAIFGDTLELISGQLKVRALGITSSELGTNAVTTAKITDGSVITDKIANLNVTANKIAASTITIDKMAVAALATTAQAKAETASVLIAADKVKQTPPAAKAYGSFTIATTARTLSGSYNIASVTRINSNNTQVTFATGGAMASSSYVVVAQTTDSGSTAGALDQNAMPYNKATNGFKIFHNAELTDRAIDFVVFGTLA